MAYQRNRMTITGMRVFPFPICSVVIYMVELWTFMLFARARVC